MIDSLIKNRIQQLPANTRYAIEHFDWVGAVRKIAEKYHLLLDDTEFLHREVMLSILELITPEEFMKSLQKLPIPEEEIPSLLTDIQHEIAIPLQRMEFSEETLKKVKEEKMRKEMEEKLSHEEVKNSFRDEGIVLVDEDEDISSIPDEGSRLLQEREENDTTEEFLQEEGKTNRETEEILKQEQESIQEIQNFSSKEEPEDSDYNGVTLHRVPGVSGEKGKSISIGKYTIVPPKKKIVSLKQKNTDFLKHIGAI